MRQYNESVRGKLYQYFQQRLSLKKSTGGWVRCDCVLCNGHQTMGINLTKSKVHCFKCEEQLTPFQLLMELENIPDKNGVWTFLNLRQEYERYQDYKTEKLDRKEVQLPKEFRLIDDVDSKLGKYAQNYVRKRGFRVKELATKGVGYCTHGKYLGYVIFPYYENGNLVFFQGRKFIDIGPKMKNPEKSEFGVGKADIVYNSDSLYIYNCCYLAESITNCLTLGDRCCGLSGKSISPKQFNKILTSPCEKFIVILDPDALDKAIKLCMQLVHYKEVKLVVLPKGKDINDIGRKETLRLVRKESWLSYRELLKKKIELNEKSAQHTYYRRGPHAIVRRRV